MAPDHIDGDQTLNNIRADRGGSVDVAHNNLRWWYNQRNMKLFSNNSSGVNGVSWCNTKHGWNVSWYAEGGKKRNKYFLARPKDDVVEKQKQLQAAANFRAERDAETSCTNGQRPK